MLLPMVVSGETSPCPFLNPHVVFFHHTFFPYLTKERERDELPIGVKPQHGESSVVLSSVPQPLQEKKKK